MSAVSWNPYSCEKLVLEIKRTGCTFEARYMFCVILWIHQIHWILIPYLLQKISRKFLQNLQFIHYSRGSRGGPRGPGPPPDPRFWGPKIEHFAALFNFSIIFFASLRSAYYFFNMLLFHSSNWKIFQPRFARHVISHLQVLVSHILGY